MSINNNSIEKIILKIKSFEKKVKMYSYFEQLIQDNVSGISDLKYLSNGASGIVF